MLGRLRLRVGLREVVKAREGVVVQARRVVGLGHRVERAVTARARRRPGLDAGTDLAAGAVDWRRARGQSQSFLTSTPRGQRGSQGRNCETASAPPLS